MSTKYIVTETINHGGDWYCAQYEADTIREAAMQAVAGSPYYSRIAVPMFNDLVCNLIDNGFAYHGWADYELAVVIAPASLPPYAGAPGSVRASLAGAAKVG